MTGHSLLDFFQTICYKDSSTATEDYSHVPLSNGICFEMKKTNYDAMSNYLDDLFTPAWSNTNAQDVDNQNDAIIRAKTDRNGNIFDNGVTDEFQLKISQESKHTHDGPGNFVSQSITTEHGSFADLHIGYVAAVLTNAHEGRAIILNEDVIFNTLSTSSFGSLFMQALFPSPTVETRGDGDYYVEKAEPSSLKNLKQLLDCLYLLDADRFAESATNECLQLPFVTGDTLSIKLNITGNVQMSTQFLQGVDSAGAKTVLANITAIGNQNPSTYTKPINHSGIARDAGIHDNITVDGTVGVANSSVTTPLRTQVYKLTLPF